MRRLIGLVFTAVVMMTLTAGPSAAQTSNPTSAAQVGGEESSTILAVEGEPVGPAPMEREDENNPARELAGFEDPDVPFTYGAAFILTFAGFVGLSLLVGLYWLLVQRPSRESAERS